jgi:tetratricopeptide (TPR) repeat protein
MTSKYNKFLIIVGFLIIGVGSVIASPVTQPEELYKQGTSSFIKGDFRSAITEYQQAVNLASENGSYHVALGCAYGGMGVYDSALVELQKGVALDSSRDSVYYLIEGYYAKAGQSPEAASFFEKAATDHPQNPTIRLNWGYSLYRLDSLEQSKEQMEKARDLNPRYAQAYCGLGLVALARGELDQAQAALDTALAIDPNYSEARLYLSAVLMEQGKVKESLRERTIAIKQDPTLAPYANQLDQFNMRNEIIYEKREKGMERETPTAPLITPVLETIALHLIRPENRPPPITKKFNVSFGLGISIINSDVWYTLTFLPALSLKYFATMLDLNLLMNDKGKIRTQEWDWHKILNNIQVGTAGGPLLLSAGKIENFSLGYGFVMNNYSNQPAENALQTGGRVDVMIRKKDTYVGVQSMTNNVEKPQVFAGRVYCEQWAPKEQESFWHKFEFGLTAATDAGHDSTGVTHPGATIMGGDALFALSPRAAFDWGFFTEETKILNHGFGGLGGLFFVRGADTSNQFKAMAGGFFSGQEFEPAYFNAFYEKDRLTYGALGINKESFLKTQYPRNTGGFYAVAVICQMKVNTCFKRRVSTFSISG